MDIWPNFFIVGATKAGTTSLYEYLRTISKIYMSPIKEPNYFNHVAVPNDDPIKFMIRDKKKYLELFKNVKNEKIIGEATPTYLLDPNTPLLIHKVSPNAKFLITLRNPIDRIFSVYLMMFNLGRISYSIEDLVESLEKNGQQPDRTTQEFYTPLIKRYLDVFGAKCVKIIIYEEWIKNIQETITSILEFLGLDNEDLNVDKKIHNPFRSSRGSISKFVINNKTIVKLSRKVLGVKTRNAIMKKILFKKSIKPELQIEYRKRLAKVFTEDFKNLEKLLGKKLPWNDFSFPPKS